MPRPAICFGSTRTRCPYSISYPAGPRCTPTIDGDHVYILGSEGDLNCLRTSDGEVIWSRSLKARLRGRSSDLGIRLASAGRRRPALHDGWRSRSRRLSPSIRKPAKSTGKHSTPKQDIAHPSIIDAGGTRQLIVFHPEAIVSLNPVDGVKVLEHSDQSVVRNVDRTPDGRRQSDVCQRDPHRSRADRTGQRPARRQGTVARRAEKCRSQRQQHTRCLPTA